MSAVLLLLALAADVEPADPASKMREVTARARLAAVEDAAKPVKISTEKELAKALPDKEALAGLKKQVDFSKEYLLVFTWSGSGGDRIVAEVQKGKKGTEAVFKRTFGATDDLVRHQKLFALPKKMTYRMAK